MPNFIQYSPWQDAANVGQGLGHTLGQILLQLPLLRDEEARKAEEFKLREREVAAHELMAKEHAGYFEAMGQNLPQKLALANLLGQDKITTNQNLRDFRNIKGQDIMNQSQSKIDVNQARASYYDTHGDELVAEGQSRRGLRTKEGTYLDTKNSLMPGQVASANKAHDAAAALHGILTLLAPGKAEDYHSQVNANLVNAGLPQMPSRITPQVGQPQAAPSGLVPNMPFNNTVSTNRAPGAGLGRATSVTNAIPRQLILRDPVSGKRFYGQPEDAKANPHLEVIGDAP